MPTRDGILGLADGQFSIGQDGKWKGDNKEFTRSLNEAFPLPGTEAGTPWVIAFWEAVHDLRAKVIQEPEDDSPYPPTAKDT